MEAKETRPLPPKGRQSGRVCQSKRQSGLWMSNCSLGDRPGGRQIAPMPHDAPQDVPTHCGPRAGGGVDGPPRLPTQITKPGP